MTSLYPRLSFGDAIARLAELREARQRGGNLDAFAAFNHPRASYAPTGGSVSGENELAAVREAVSSVVSDMREREGTGRSKQVETDLAIGRALGRTMNINPADAGHDSVWSFLTLVVLPDVAFERFPDAHEERMVGGHRNVFRRLWVRERVVGDLMLEARNPLGEDEMVGIFERTELSRNRPLVRAMARTVMLNKSTNRSEFARNFYKRVRFHTGPYSLDLHSEEELLTLFAGFAEDLA